MRKWTLNNIPSAYHKVKGMSRRQAKLAGLEKEWWAVYRHNKKLLINVQNKVYSLNEIQADRTLREYILDVLLLKHRK